jgi:hypothetical protein
MNRHATPKATAYEQLRRAFAELRERGYFARRNWQCCTSCGWFAIPEHQQARVVFYHAQDAESFRDYGWLHLAWNGDGQEIAQVMRDHGLTVEWNGSDADKIKVVLSGPTNFVH